MTKFLRAALEYARRGFKVFPCIPGDKAPAGQLVPNGYHDASKDEDTIRGWWADVPEANIGLPCAPNSLLVLDVDPRAAGDDALNELLAGEELPETPTADTGGGGIHLVFALPDYQTCGKAAEGLDVKVKGYIVVAPSVHPSGGGYRWRDGLRLGDVPPAPVPEWLEQAIRRRERSTSPAAPAQPPTGDRLTDREVAVEALAALAPGRADHYDEWIAVGQALHAVSDGLLPEWIEWSRRSERFKSDEDCERHWRSFHRGGGITLGTLVAKAREDGSDLLMPGSRNTTSTASPAPAEPLEERPVIVVSGRGFEQKIDDARAAVEKANDPPDLFLRSGQLVEVVADEHDLPVIRAATVESVRARMARAATWVRKIKTKDGFETVAADPPKDVVASAMAEARWRVPGIDAVTQVPTLRPDGTVNDRPGYDPETRLFYRPPQTLRVPTIPDRPTQRQAVEALGRVFEPLSEFPYETNADKAHILALLLTPIVRPAVQGRVPLALIDAPQAGTGKSLLAEAPAIIVTGTTEFSPAPQDEDKAEWRKLITTILMTGATVITFDNVEDVLRSQYLVQAITQDVWQDRTLGRNEVVRVPVRATWIATGNNLRVGRDLPRRCYRISIDAKTAEPFRRDGFKIPNLRGHLYEHRGELLADLLTAARAWYAAGKPEAERPVTLGNFEEWCRIVGGILSFCGWQGFLSNVGELYEAADPDAAAWRDFFVAWNERFEDKAVTTKQVADLCDRVAMAARSGQQELPGGNAEGEASEAEDAALAAEDAALAAKDAALAEAVPETLLQDNGKINRKSFGKQLDKQAGHRYVVAVADQQEATVWVDHNGRDTDAKVAKWSVKREEVDSNPVPKNPLPERDGEGATGFPGFQNTQARGTSETEEDRAYESNGNQTPETPCHERKPALGADSKHGVSEPNPVDPDLFASEDPVLGSEVAGRRAGGGQ